MNHHNSLTTVVNQLATETLTLLFDETRVAFVINDQLVYSLRFWNTFLQQALYFFMDGLSFSQLVYNSLEGSRFLGCFQLRCLTIDLTVNL